MRKPHEKRALTNSNKSDSKNFQITSILNSSFASLGIASKIKEYKVKKAWAQCVGENISKKAAPVRQIGTVLHCHVSSSPWMTELNYQKALIISKINERMGFKAVTDIIFRIGPIETPLQAEVYRAPNRQITPEERQFIEDTTSGIKDNKLKELIKRVIEKRKSET